VTREDVAQALLGRTHGIVFGQYRAGEDPVPIRIRSPQGEYFPLPELQTVNVYGDTGQPIPLAQVASATLEMQPAAINHYSQHRVARVSAELGEGFVYSEVLEPIREAISGLDLPSGTRIEYGGEAEASAEANTALLQAAPLGAGLLLFFLLLEFNSFRRLGLVLLTIPFAVAGVIPGLLLLGIPFGFQPLQGIIALVGIVVNNAIVLIDVIDRRLGEGEDIVRAVRDAVRRRTRPILLTTATTVAGLLPLALSDTTLWPPMAWTIIAGLLASTVLTLLVLPALCRLLLGRGRMPAAPAAASVLLAAVAAGGLLPAAPVQAEEASAVDFMSAAVLGARQPDSRARVFEARAAAADAAAERRLGRYPTLQVDAFVSRSDGVGEIEIPPLGPDVPAQRFPTGARERSGVILALRQPLLNPAQQFFVAPAAEYAATAAEANAADTKLANAIDAVEIYLDALDLRARLDANRALRESLDARAARVERLLANGRALISDRAEVRFARQRVEQAGVRLRENYRLAQARLARAVGRDGRVQPAPLDFEARPVTREMPALLDEALAVRRDLAALDLQIRELELRIGEADARRLPNLDAVASLRYNDGNAFAPEREGRIEAQITWTPFAAGAIGARKGAAQARLAALREERLSFARAVRVQIEQTLAELETANALTELAAAGAESARTTRDARSARFEAGRATVDQVLEAEADLAEQRAQTAIARHDRVRAWVRLQGTLGDSAWIDSALVDGAD
jgi:outer membrane protein TolC